MARGLPILSIAARATAAFACALLCNPVAAVAQLTSSVPEGFEDLEAQRTQQVDVYFEGRLLGLFEVTIDGENISFSQPESILQTLPANIKSQQVLDALSTPLNRNLSRACPRSIANNECGTLTPEVVGLIHYLDRFELRLFVNPSLRLVDAGPSYLPPPSSDLDIQSYASFLLSGGDNDGDLRVNAEIDTIVSFGEVRVLNTLSYADQTDLRIGEMVGEVDFNEGRAFSGLFWSRAGLGFRRERLIGVGIQSQIDTRLDKDTVVGTPLNVYLQTPGKMEVILDGRVLYVTTLPAGSNTIDTSSFPQGNYELTLRTTEADGTTQTETRFFSKGLAVPQIGSPIYFGEVGIPMPWTNSAVGAAQPERPMARAGAAWRLSQNFSVGSGAQFIESELDGRLTAAHYNEDFLVEAMGSIGTKGSKLASLSMASTSRGRLNYSLDARYVDLRRSSDIGGFFQNEKYGRLNAALSYVRNRVRLAIIANSLHTNSRTEYSVATTGQYDLVRRSDLFVSLVGEYSNTSFGDSWSLGVSLRLFSAKIGATSSVGFRRTGAGSDSRGIYSSHSLNASHELDIEKRLFGALTYEVAPEAETLGGTVELDAKSFALNGSFLQSVQNRNTFSQFAIGGAGSLIYSANEVTPGHRSTREATVLVTVQGSTDEERFELIIDGKLHSIIEGGDQQSIVLPSYRAYQLRLRPRQSRPMVVIDPVRDISLYPGNIREIDWEIARQVAVIGQLVNERGDPITNATLRWEKEIAVTDDAGFFQLELAPSALVNVQTRDGDRLQVVMPAFDEDVEFMRLGPVKVEELLKD